MNFSRSSRVFVCFGVWTIPCSAQSLLLPDLLFKHHFWWGYGNHVMYWKLNPGWPCARHMLYSVSSFQNFGVVSWSILELKESELFLLLVGVSFGATSSSAPGIFRTLVRSDFLIGTDFCVKREWTHIKHMQVEQPILNYLFGPG